MDLGQHPAGQRARSPGFPRYVTCAQDPVFWNQKWHVWQGSEARALKENYPRSGFTDSRFGRPSRVRLGSARPEPSRPCADASRRRSRRHNRSSKQPIADWTRNSLYEYFFCCVHAEPRHTFCCFRSPFLASAQYLTGIRTFYAS